jgi:hypothetical protein
MQTCVPAGKIGERGRKLKPAIGAFRLQGPIFSSLPRGFARLSTGLASQRRVRKANEAGLAALSGGLGAVSWLGSVSGWDR